MRALVGLDKLGYVLEGIGGSQKTGLRHGPMGHLVWLQPDMAVTHGATYGAVLGPRVFPCQLPLLRFRVFACFCFSAFPAGRAFLLVRLKFFFF